MERPRLRDNKGKEPYELYPIGQIPESSIIEIAKWMTYFFAVGKSDINGEDWGDVFAKAVGGEHLGKPVGLADVVCDGMAWSVKSVKAEYPHQQQSIRIISGRCSPDYSYGITDPHEDVQRTGTAVLSIWNERVKETLIKAGRRIVEGFSRLSRRFFAGIHPYFKENQRRETEKDPASRWPLFNQWFLNIAKEKFEPLRTSVLVRNFTSLEFSLFEHEVVRFITSDYAWRVNKNGNLEGYAISSGKHCFTWQPHGSQFTILMEVPPSASKFHIKRPAVFDFDTTMTQIGFDDSWVTIL